MIRRAFPASQESDYPEVPIAVSASVRELKLEFDYTPRPFVCFGAEPSSSQNHRSVEGLHVVGSEEFQPKLPGVREPGGMVPADEFAAGLQRFYPSTNWGGSAPARHGEATSNDDDLLASAPASRPFNEPARTADQEAGGGRKRELQELPAVKRRGRFVPPKSGLGCA